MHPAAETAHSAPSSKAASLEGLPMDSNPAVGPSQWDEEREGQPEPAAMRHGAEAETCDSRARPPLPPPPKGRGRHGQEPAHAAPPGSPRSTSSRSSTWSSGSSTRRKVESFSGPVASADGAVDADWHCPAHPGMAMSATGSTSDGVLRAPAAAGPGGVPVPESGAVSNTGVVETTVTESASLGQLMSSLAPTLQQISDSLVIIEDDVNKLTSDVRELKRDAARQDADVGGRGRRRGAARDGCCCGCCC